MLGKNELKNENGNLTDGFKANNKAWRETLFAARDIEAQAVCYLLLTAANILEYHCCPSCS